MRKHLRKQEISLLKRFYTLIVILLPLVSVAYTPDTIKLATYNILNYPGSTGTSRDPYFKTIIDSLQPDILVVEEVSNTTGALRFLDSVMLKSNADYGMGTVINNVVAPSEAENAIYYRKSKFTFISNTPIITTLRDINEFKLIHKASLIPFSVFGVHLKAGNTAADITRRASEVDSLRKVTDAKNKGENFIVCGDFNTYNNTESDYTKLLFDNIINDGELFDPINLTGTWNNPAYARYHTQATRVLAEPDGGSTSGIDDRFDLILYSDGVKNIGEMDYVSGSETPYGNDGNHFNDSVNAGVNNAVSNLVAFALHHASDHLPVSAKFRFYNTVLPVELVAFNGKNEGDNNNLFWSTASEFNNLGFEIQRSEDAGNWNNIGFLESNLLQHQFNHYEFTDSLIAVNATYYYRLKQIDFDGTFSYSNIIQIRTVQTVGFYIYPNPAANSLTIFSDNTSNSTFNLYDVTGRLIFGQIITSNETKLDVSWLDNGVYFIVCNNTSAIKFLKE